MSDSNENYFEIKGSGCCGCLLAILVIIGSITVISTLIEWIV